MLLESKTEEAIAKELGVSTRTVQRYKVILDQRYGAIWKQKTHDTLFLECNLFKNRMLKLYRALEDVVTSDDKMSGTDKAKCAEVASNIATNIVRLESEGIRFTKQLGLAVSSLANKNTANLNNLRNNCNDYNVGSDNNSHHHYQNHQIEEDDNDRKF